MRDDYMMLLLPEVPRGVTGDCNESTQKHAF